MCTAATDATGRHESQKRSQEDEAGLLCCSRKSDDIVNGAADPGVEVNEHIDFVNPSRRLMSRAVSC